MRGRMPLWDWKRKGIMGIDVILADGEIVSMR